MNGPLEWIAAIGTMLAAGMIALDLGRNLFAYNRAMVSPADKGALSISCGVPIHDEDVDEDTEYALGSDPVEAAEAPHEAKDA